ncbi:MAG: hypothetical protein AABY22_02760 [Nanoarchaeota archaeon]
MKQKESDLVKACLELLAYKKIFAKRQNTGATRTERGGFIRFGIVGAGDIVTVVDGHHIEIEVKITPNKQSIAQQQYQQELEKAKGIYWLIYSLEELMEKLKQLT